MHGVGGVAIVRAFEVFNLPELIPVVEQMQPDPEFPTVKFPNPCRRRKESFGEQSTVSTR